MIPLVVRREGRSPLGVVIQQGTRECASLLALTEARHCQWAHRHDLDYSASYARILADRPPVWDCIYLIRQALESHPYALWLDADTLVMRPEVSPLAALRWGEIGMCCHSWPTVAYHYNAGVIAVRASGATIKLFDDVLAWDEGGTEQDALNTLLGRRGNDILEIMPAEWNSGLANRVPDPIIRAWHGEGTQGDRLEKMTAELGRLG